MTREKGLASFSANFEAQKSAPIDARMIVDTKADLLLEATWTANDSGVYVYKGMIVSVHSDGTIDNNGLYRLKDVDYTQESNWEKVGAGELNTDEKVKYDSEDPTAGYVSDKVIAGSGISVAEGTGANENKLVITNDAPAVAETDPLSLHLNQTSPQTFSAGDVAGTGLLKVTSGLLGLNTSTYLTDITSESIADLSDVDSIAGIVDGKILKWDTNKFVVADDENTTYTSSDFDIKDLTDSTNLRTTWSGKEDSLGNPAVDDYVLSSKIDGTRSWVENSGGDSLTFTSPLTRTDDDVAIAKADATTDGYLSSTDWNTFNDKADTDTTYTAGDGINITEANVIENTDKGSDVDLSGKANTANAMGVVNHGATANTARPTGYLQMMWIGTVAPDNKEVNDIWIDLS